MQPGHTSTSFVIASYRQVCPVKSWHFPVENVLSSLARNAELCCPFSWRKSGLRDSHFQEKVSWRNFKIEDCALACLKLPMGFRLAHYFLNLDVVAVIWSFLVSGCHNSLCGMKWLFHLKPTVSPYRSHISKSIPLQPQKAAAIHLPQVASLHPGKTTGSSLLGHRLRGFVQWSSATASP